MAYELSRGLAIFLGPTDSGAATSTPNIDTAFVFETSGDCWFCRFNAPVGQSAATITVYVYCTAVTGTPDYQLEVRNAYAGSGDADRPETGGANLASSPSTLALGAGDVGTWVALTATVSLTAGNGYYCLVKNTHATPASNYATFQYRSVLDAYANTVLSKGAGYTLDGFATDGTTAGADGAFVVKFSDGTLFGNPYVTSAAHASNTNHRGNRFLFSEDLAVSGATRATASSTLSGISIYTAAGALIVAAAGDAYAEVGTGGCYRFAPTTLSGGVWYDVVHTVGSASTVGTVISMGETEGNVPADVLACRPWSLAYVDGATPGSYTVDTSKAVVALSLIVDDYPAIAGGGGNPPNLSGGMQ